MDRILVRTLVVLVACSMLASAGTALAGNGATNGTIQTRNDTDNKAWITIYDLGKTRHLDYGDLNAHSTRAWTNCCYAAGSYYHVRAEVQDGKGHTIYDDLAARMHEPDGAGQPRLSLRVCAGYASQRKRKLLLDA